MIQKKQEEAGGGRERMEKVVVVSQWTSMLNIVKKHLQKINMKFAEINGKQDALNYRIKVTRLGVTLGQKQ